MLYKKCLVRANSRIPSTLLYTIGVNVPFLVRMKFNQADRLTFMTGI
nr:MAG TPA_asm: hypothetical protein [Caudoviricetes sp.]